MRVLVLVKLLMVFDPVITSLEEAKSKYISENPYVLFVKEDFWLPKFGLWIDLHTMLIGFTFLCLNVLDSWKYLKALYLSYLPLCFRAQRQHSLLQELTLIKHTHTKETKRNKFTDSRQHNATYGCLSSHVATTGSRFLFLSCGSDYKIIGGFYKWTEYVSE